MKSCVIIPIYKAFQTLDRFELTSLSQGYYVFKSYEIYLVCSFKFDTREYECHALRLGVKVNVKRFPPKYFKNIHGYNLLMLSSKFYKAFLHYNFLLIYQTDAYVFHDELRHWSKKGIDYIGAPWIEDTSALSELVLSAGGNGGFSLRNISKHYHLALHIEKLQLIDRALRYTFVSRFINPENILLKFWKRKFQPKDEFSITMLTKGFYAFNEDGNWSRNIALASLDFNVASPETALKFSFEKRPEALYEKNNSQLPFGCHAFPKYNWEFWAKFISLTTSI